MKTEKIIEQIEKLIEEKLRAGAILQSKSLGDQKEFFLSESHKKMKKIKDALAEALNQPQS